MTLCHSVWLGMSQYASLWLCILCMPTYDTVPLCMALFNSVWLSVTLLTLCNIAWLYALLCMSLSVSVGIFLFFLFILNFTHYGHANQWLCFTPFDSLWLCLLCLCSNLISSVDNLTIWLYFILFNYIKTSFYMSDSKHICVILIDYIWIYLNIRYPVWICLTHAVIYEFCAC